MTSSEIRKNSGHEFQGKAHMGRFDQGVETQFLCHFAWCIARLVAPVQKLIQQLFFYKLIS